jgi:nicotinamidase-related amidase
MKATISALAGTDLDAHLRNRGIRNLVLCGFATNFVVEGTARQAVDAGYAVTILSDGCSSFDSAWHEMSLQVLALLTTVSTIDEFSAALRGGNAAMGRQPARTGT